MIQKYTENNFLDLPWKNGLGLTRELFKIPHSQNQDQFVFRLSAAKVTTSGPFSLFPGIKRTLVLLQGTGMRLKFTHKTLELKGALDLMQFDGGEETYCELISGPCLDFNIMIDPKWGSAQVSILYQETVSIKTHRAFIYEMEQKVLWEINGESEDLSFVNSYPAILIELTN
jgi:environmental stress-induced protein Ves